jgi:hypothetical protein
MIHVTRPRDDELPELKRMMRQEVGRVSQRAHMVLLSADHHPMPEIAAFSAYSRATVRSWLRRFDRLGPHRSDRIPRPGPKPPFTRRDAVSASPGGRFASFGWSSPVARPSHMVICEFIHVTYCEEYHIGLPVSILWQAIIPLI